MLKMQSQNAKIASQNRKKIFACGGGNPRFARELIAKLLSLENSNAAMYNFLLYNIQN